MTRVVLDDENVIAALDAVPQRAEVCDRSGRVLGYYVPKSADQAVFRGVKSPLSAEERQRLIKEEGPMARSLNEFWDEMKHKYPDAYDPGFWDEMKRPNPDELT